MPADTSLDMLNTLQFFQGEAAAGKTLHIIKSYTGEPTGVPGIAMLLVSGPDEMIRELHDALDRLVQAKQAEHGLEDEVVQ